MAWAAIIPAALGLLSSMSSSSSSAGSNQQAAAQQALAAQRQAAGGVPPYKPTAQSVPLAQPPMAAPPIAAPMQAQTSLPSISAPPEGQRLQDVLARENEQNSARLAELAQRKEAMGQPAASGNLQNYASLINAAAGLGQSLQQPAPQGVMPQPSPFNYQPTAFQAMQRPRRFN